MININIKNGHCDNYEYDHVANTDKISVGGKTYTIRNGEVVEKFSPPTLILKMRGLDDLDQKIVVAESKLSDEKAKKDKAAGTKIAELRAKRDDLLSRKIQCVLTEQQQDIEEKIKAERAKKDKASGTKIAELHAKRNAVVSRQVAYGLRDICGNAVANKAKGKKDEKFNPLVAVRNWTVENKANGGKAENKANGGKKAENKANEGNALKGILSSALGNLLAAPSDQNKDNGEKKAVNKDNGKKKL
ncbi:MAG: hypothetical protein LBI56_02615 [Puniceicoccales bacterium]|jgi:hypothetical protein|nr:hypothetical protein [Puniceicoccales bacterium]